VQPRKEQSRREKQHGDGDVGGVGAVRCPVTLTVEILDFCLICWLREEVHLGGESACAQVEVYKWPSRLSLILRRACLITQG
jgi:hypothetical protein